MELNDPVTTLKQISNGYAPLLAKLDIFTIKDLLTHFPKKYIDTSEVTSIKDMILSNDFENTFQIRVFIDEFKSSFLRSRKTIQTATVSDATGKVKCIWFNQKFLSEVFIKDKEFILSGKMKRSKSSVVFYPTSYEQIIENRELVHLARITPEYTLTEGISKKWFRNRIKQLTDSLSSIQIRNELDSYKISDQLLKQSILNTHFPVSEDDLKVSLKILSLYELVNIQLKLEEKRAKSRKFSAPQIQMRDGKNLLNDLYKKIPFKLTNDQEQIISNLTTRIFKGELLNDLIQGDVGSGKTIIALALALIIVKSGYQAIILAPTTLLAEQHHKSFQKFLEDFGIDIELVTSKNRSTKSKAILIGTSAVLARQMSLINKPGLIIVDEQHRFGVSQREELLKPFSDAINSGFFPHFINMTATPIPRTIAQAFFGDITINTIKTKPAGRLDIKTFLVPENKRNDSFKWIEKEMTSGNQVFWLCPLISDSENLEIKSAEEVFKQLKTRFPKHEVALMHGKLKDEQKTQVMQDFLDKKYNILVSTSVIEVGIDIPNATIMVIENAERFGLAQLHQIRGRVGRGESQSWCFLFYGNEITAASVDRLKFLSENTDGLKIAEYDLAKRGPGEVYGFKQSGIPFLKIARLDSTEQIIKSKELARELFEKGIRSIELFS
jgi:ATP-dependent DNA helicase RecG